MAGKLVHIKSRQRPYPTQVAVLICTDHMQHLVSKRTLVNKYETNRFIKYIATYYLLKALSPESGWILNWTSQKEYLLQFLQMNENTFRSHLKALKEIGLVEVHKKEKKIQIYGFAAAAEILGIEYFGTYNIEYDHQKTHSPAGMPVAPQKQTFQYLLRAEEFERQKEKQLNRVLYKIEENPNYFEDIIYLLTQLGADPAKLRTDGQYMRERLLQMQMFFFKQGSDLLEYVYHARADINRGVKRIAKHHGYRSAQSVSYLKRRMWRLGIIQVLKISSQSLNRSRLYFKDPETGEKKEGYKWIKNGKCTALFLTDQISPLYKTFSNQQKAMQKTA